MKFITLKHSSYLEAKEKAKELFELPEVNSVSILVSKDDNIIIEYKTYSEKVLKKVLDKSKNT